MAPSPRRRPAAASAPAARPPRTRSRAPHHLRGGRLLFQRAAQRALSGQLAANLFAKTQEHWLRGRMAPSAFRRRVDELERQYRRLVAFCSAALIDGVLRPLNGPPRRIRDDEDWAEAVENLDGFRDMLLHQVAAVPPPAMTPAERRELARFCAARGARGAACEPPCRRPARGLGGILGALLGKGKKGAAPSRCAPPRGVAAPRALVAPVLRRERAMERARVLSLSPPSSRGSAYEVTVPRRMDAREGRFSAVRRQAAAAGVQLVGGRAGRPLTRPRAPTRE
jgi:hypothetical protein